MAARTGKRKRDTALLAGWQSMPERAPSIIAQDQPTIARFIALISLLLVAMGGFANVIPALRVRFTYFVAPGTGFLLLSLGVCGLLYHAVRERDQQYRRTYGVLGLTLLAVAGFSLLLRLFRVEGPWGQMFLPYGVPLFGLGLGFLLAVGRQETDTFWRPLIVRIIGGAGAALVVVGFVGSNVNANFLQGEGVLLLLLGLLYVAAFVGMNGVDSRPTFWAGVGLGIVGGLGLTIALARSILSGMREGGGTEAYLVPAGLLLMGISLIYLLVAIAICSDAPLVVLTRRELAAFFYSPIAYLVFLGVTLVGFLMFWNFMQLLTDPRRTNWEPIVRDYILAFIPVVTVLFIVPVLTMRLLSEEKRSGTLEVLLTAPVNEWAVVVSKFLATLVFYLLALLPWGLYLVALRIMGGEPFDYRPVLSFFFALAFTGAGFLAVGMFFSSVTRNQIIAAVMTFAAMIAFTVMSRFFIRIGPPWGDVLSYISYLDLWLLSLEGIFAPRYLLFHLSLAIFFLFMTTKILEARKWS
jgi:ABC-2 type transport system permease protein